jgi:hypothetical protein
MIIQDSLVAARLETLGVLFTATYVTRTYDYRDWEHFLWRVTFERVNGKRARLDTDYRCDVGFVQPGKEEEEPLAPTAAAVLHSLLMDAGALDQSFSDWCGDCGYDEDSRKALATYEACCAIGHKLRKLFSAEERAELSKLLEDY